MVNCNSEMKSRAAGAPRSIAQDTCDGLRAEPSTCNVLLHIAFVCGWTVDRWHWNIVQPEVNAHLRAVMNQMVHDHAPHHCHTRHTKNRLSAAQQCPGLHQRFIVSRS